MSNTESHKPTIAQFLESHTERDLRLLREGGLISIPANETAAKALTQLVTHGILSAPIIEDNKVIGLVDMKDFTGAVLEMLASASLNTVPPHISSSLHSGNWQLNLAFHGEMERKLVKEIPMSSTINIVKEGSNLLDIVKALGQGIHRVLVEDSQHNIINLLTQTALLNFTVKHIGDLGHLGAMTVDELGLANQRSIICVHINELTATAFSAMMDANISAVPVVDDQGHIVGNLSFTDLKGIGKGFHVTSLNLPVQAFLKIVRSCDIEIKNPTIFCKRDATFATVLQKMCAARIHRIYVVNNQMAPTGVISLTDVLRVIGASH